MIDRFELFETNSDGDATSPVQTLSLQELRTRLSLRWPAEMPRLEHLVALAQSAPGHPVDLSVWRDLPPGFQPLSLQGDRQPIWFARLTYRP